ncbi:MAG: SipW-dependent-type signal peptide-containing protein [Firmicutes bacterium]|nr:SipW-dependent-type signal peptide-containing protein [Bacillota bacterium]
MTNTKATKRALLLSVMAMLVCVAMLVGTTFAWFTDSASTAVNKIQAGTLEILLLDERGNSLEGETLGWVAADGREQDEILWEPGCTYELQPIVIKNNGNLALKYKIVITGIQGDAELNQAIEWTITNTSGTTALDADHALAVGASDTLTIKGHMKEDAGNEYQGKSIDNIAITVYATQDTVESDSTNNQYDKDAEYAIPVATAGELAEALASGNDVVLTAPIQMPDVIEIKSDVTIYGSENGKLLAPDNKDRVINITDNTEPIILTLSGVDVVGPISGAYTRGVSVYGTTDVTIVVDNSSVSANYYALNIAGDNDNVDVVVRNATITGWCAFQTWSAGTKATFENCTLIGNNDKGYNADGWNDFATVVINTDTASVDLTFKNCRIEANQTTGNKQYLLSVRAGGCKVTLDGCTYFANGAEIADEDLGSYISLYSAAIDLVLTIDGTIIPIS